MKETCRNLPPEAVPGEKHVMLDTAARRLIDPPLNVAGQLLARWGIGANAITLAGLGFGVTAAACIAWGWPGWALVPLSASRLADGLDGAVARASGRTDFGGILDIVCDFVFYAAVPFGFVLADPAGNGAAGAFLLLSFYVNGASFLGFAAVAGRRGLETTAQGAKSFFYSRGLLEGTETIAFFVAICLWPAFFAPLAWGFGGVCLLSALLRLLAAARAFRG